MVINQTSDRHETLMVSMAPGRVPRSGMVCMSLASRRSELPAPVSTDPLECFLTVTFRTIVVSDKLT